MAAFASDGYNSERIERILRRKWYFTGHSAFLIQLRKN